ncbi:MULTISPECIES: hypothetical protein [unclassified Novosphingobium]|uniref:hypothetical protein n=1 Tax=unclassified Novosphingobium TaxID=2644732 RepID=UPI0017BF2BDD|nr:hypothetical protein [Novosphingobium sp. GV055]MBB3357361.1 hypothetical protein [Novosphingobium sp. BK256]MBB3373977.1 hypothetical protein [Novosphingobium sp. BK280]MBB3378389.1 hypothetical protein [Novosphingobium sp. BK258]MBB3419827.1 hypothetical protein [Novosphingobium sp. BK267]MBB3447852.1 hypothetical protein [Novosphingobium sp. BK352]MBB3477259.1 hypothetical protein [Novosphingobium sp. BK369]MBB3500309.1 hypothetical protein [Novosphingobium sp. BK336]MBB3536349.1 hypo
MQGADVCDPGQRDYCLFLNGFKYNRNGSCRRHDNAYGIAGGGREADRRRADAAFFRGLRQEGDPMAVPVWLAVRTFGWFFFNYHGFPWRGQLVRKIFPRY